MYLLRHDSWDAQQIGITNRPEQRLATHRRNGWEVHDLRGPMDGFLARALERDVLALLRKKGIRKAADRFDGHTESWSSTVFSCMLLSELIDQVRDSESTRAG